MMSTPLRREYVPRLEDHKESTNSTSLAADVQEQDEGPKLQLLANVCFGCVVVAQDLELENTTVMHLGQFCHVIEVLPRMLCILRTYIYH